MEHGQSLLEALPVLVHLGDPAPELVVPSGAQAFVEPAQALEDLPFHEQVRRDEEPVPDIGRVPREARFGLVPLRGGCGSGFLDRDGSTHVFGHPQGVSPHGEPVLGHDDVRVHERQVLPRGPLDPPVPGEVGPPVRNDGDLGHSPGLA